MLKENLNITRYTVYNEIEDAYDIFLIPEIDNNRNESMDFYIQKRGCSIMTFAIGITPEDYERINIEDFIKDNVNEWIESCEDDIATLYS